MTLGLSTQELDNLLDTLSCLQLAAHRILIVAGTELRQFQAFSGWLRQEIDIQAIDASSSDTTEKDVNVDHVTTLEYIQGPMMRSQLTISLGLQPPAEGHLLWDLAAEKTPLLELYTREHKINPAKGSSPRKLLPGIDVLIGHLGLQCENIFNQIAETQRRNVRFGDPVSLGAGTPSCMDMEVVVEVNTTKVMPDELIRLTCRSRKFIKRLLSRMWRLGQALDETRVMYCQKLVFGRVLRLI